MRLMQHRNPSQEESLVLEGEMVFPGFQRHQLSETSLDRHPRGDLHQLTVSG